MPNYRTTNMHNDNNSYGRPLDIAYPQMDEPYYSMKDEDDLAKLPLAMSYVPWQLWDKTFDTNEILSKGTLFPSLYKPFLGAGGYRS